MTRRIAFLGACPYPVPQGSQVFLRDYALALQAEGHDVCLVVYGAGIGADDSGLEVVRGPRVPGDSRTAAGPSLAKPLQDLGLVRTLRRVVRERAVEVVIAHNYEALIVALTARARPVIYHAHNAMADELPHYFGGAGWARRVGTMLDRSFPRRADAVFAPHARLAEYLIECGCDAARVHVVPPIADVQAFELATVGDGIAPVLYTGNLDAYQNLPLLFRAIETLPEARLILATAELDPAVPGAEYVHTPDFDRLRAVLARDAVVAVPRVSWSGYPVKLINAMAAGHACVACASSGWPITDGHDGLIVPDNDAPAFAAALKRLTGDSELRRRMGQNARATVKARHDPASVSRQITAIVERVLA